MGILTSDMQRVVREQRLGYVATVCPDGTPNLSPKGTTTVWDDDHLVFADIRSPGTVRNLQHNPAIEVNVVDPIVRKGYRFKGTGCVLHEGELFDQIVAFYRRTGIPQPHPDRRAGPRGTRPAAHVAGLRCRGDGGVGQGAMGAVLPRGRKPHPVGIRAPITLMLLPDFTSISSPEWSIVQPRALSAPTTREFFNGLAYYRNHLPRLSA